MQFLLNLRATVSIVMDIFVKFCCFLFTMPAHQIWSCQVTQDAKFEVFYFVLILYLILRKVTKFLVERLFTLEVISQKPHGGSGEGGEGRVGVE